MLIKQAIDKIFLPLIIISTIILYINSKLIPVIMVFSIVLYTYAFNVSKNENHKNFKAIKTLIYIGLVVSFLTSILLCYDIRTVISKNEIESLQILVFIGSIISSIWSNLDRK